jgi:hypothetical protein
MFYFSNPISVLCKNFYHSLQVCRALAGLPSLLALPKSKQKASAREAKA